MVAKSAGRSWCKPGVACQAGKPGQAKTGTGRSIATGAEFFGALYDYAKKDRAV